MSKHTPGPWTIGRPSEYGTHNADQIFHEGEGIAQVYGIAMRTTLEEAAEMPRSATGLANARLIAAAPDMLEALEAAIECGMVPISSAREGGASAFARQAVVADMIRDAVAKATGEQA